MECVIVTLDNENEYAFWNRRIIRKRLFYNNHNGGADVLILPYSELEIERMSDRKLFKIFRRISSELSGRYVFTYTNDRVVDIVDRFDVRYCDGSQIFIDLIDVIVKKVAKNSGINLQTERIGIYDYSFGRTSENVIMSLAECCSEISVYTKNISSADYVMQCIYDCTGMPVTIENNYNDWIQNKKLIILLSEFMENDIPNGVQIIDVFDLMAVKRRISKIKFEISDEFCDISALTGRKNDQELVEFILQTGAELKMGKDIKVIGYE